MIYTKLNNTWILVLLSSLVGCLLLLLLLLNSRLVVTDEKPYSLQALGDGVYWHLGQHKSLQDAGRDDVSNTGVVIGKSCIAIIDSGGSLSIGRQLLTAIRSISQLPICYVINTHIHYDHLLGNAAFVGKDTKFVGHYKLQTAIDNNQVFFQQQFATELAGTKIIAPTLLVKGKQLLDLGERVLELRSWSAAHTNTDLTVYDPTSGVIWTGDLVFRERLPRLDGNLRGWLAVMKQLQTLTVKYIIPGHGAKATNWQVALTDQRRYLQVLLKEVLAQIAQGAFLGDAIKTVAQAEAKHWQLFADTHQHNVSYAFTQLEWE